jgi:hypothetical protein
MPAGELLWVSCVSRTQLCVLCYVYYTIVEKQIIYRWILSDFSFDDGYGSPASR